ncbi:MAG: 4-hydroxybenzoate octaprenyltransferase [Magnetococcales bacterium]|nr:4-hydroxybenzoate octaprenyltransferase [Magnetococcales bacterium]
MQRLVDDLPWPLGRELLRLMRVDRPIGTWLVLWPSLWVLVAAGGGSPDWGLVMIFVTGAFVMRSAGCVANDIADRKFDPHVERTRDRPLAAGRVTLRVAIVLLLVLLLVALLLATMLNLLTIGLCFAGAFLAVSYPYTKRFIDLPQLYLGIAFGWGTVIAWAAATNGLQWSVLPFFLATVVWTTGYDTLYGLVDRDDDLKIGVRSTAILFGDRVIQAVALLYGLTLVMLFIGGIAVEASPGFFLVLMVVQGHFTWQIWRVRHGDREQAFKMFLSNQWVGMIVFIGLGLR